jgi:predicted Zn-dependent protease
MIGALGEVASSKAKSSDQVVQNLIGNGAEIMARGLDKSAEYEADRVGVVFAARAGYTPWGLPNVLQDLAGLPAKDSRTSLLYKTHPHPADRLAELGGSVGDRFDAVQGKDVADRFYRLR